MDILLYETLSLLKFYQKYLHFCFSRKNTQCYSDEKFQFGLLLIVFTTSVLFQSLYSALCICHMCVLPSSQPEIQTVIYILLVFKKSIIYCLGSKVYMHSSVVSLLVHKFIYKHYLPILSLFIISLILSGSPGILWLEIWDFICPVLPLISFKCDHVGSQTVESQRDIKAVNILPTSWLHGSEGIFILPHSVKPS